MQKLHFGWVEKGLASVQRSCRFTRNLEVSDLSRRLCEIRTLTRHFREKRQTRDYPHFYWISALVSLGKRGQVGTLGRDYWQHWQQREVFAGIGAL
jgi:hypothetical protein